MRSLPFHIPRTYDLVHQCNGWDALQDAQSERRHLRVEQLDRRVERPRPPAQAPAAPYNSAYA